MKGMKKYYTQKIMWYLFDVSLCSAAELHSSASDAGRSGFNYCVQIGRRYDRCDCNSESI